MLKILKISICFSVFALALTSITLVSKQGYAQNGIGERTFQDRRVPAETPKKRVIIRKNTTQNETPPSQDTDNIDEEAAAQNESESSSDDADANGNDGSENAQGRSSDGEPVLAIDPTDYDKQPRNNAIRDQIHEQEKNIPVKYYDENSNKENVTPEPLKKASREITCKHICDSNKERGCMRKCLNAGFCSLSFVTCENGTMDIEVDY